MTTKRDDLIGVYDEGGQTWCLKCWGEKSVLSLKPIRLKDRGSRKTCKGCKRRLSETSPKVETNSLPIILEGDGCWPDLAPLILENKVIHLQGHSMQVARMPGGMSGGRSSVSVRIDLPDGRVVIAETSMRLFLSAADAFRAKEDQQS